MNEQEFLLPLVKYADEIHRKTGFCPKIDITIKKDLFVSIMAQYLRWRTPQTLYEPVIMYHGLTIRCDK